MGKMRTHAAQQISLLFDHLVGAREQRLGNGYAKLLRGFEIDDQFKLGRNLYWKVARLFALEDAIDIAGRVTELVEQIGPIRHQAARGGFRAIGVNRWQLVLGRKPDDEIATATALNRGAGND